MAYRVFRRGDKFWVSFTLDGVRYRQSLDTQSWQEAQSRASDRFVEAKQGKLRASSSELARGTVAQALDAYLATGMAHLAASTRQQRRFLCVALRQHLGSKRLRSVTPDDIAGFIAARQQAGAANGTINLEVFQLRLVLKKARCWHRIADDVHLLPPGNEQVGRALTYEEKLRLERAASQRPGWEIARLAMVLSLNTTMRKVEIRHLRWRDVDFGARELEVCRSKTAAGKRAIPLNADAWQAVLRLRERIMLFYPGEPQPDWFLFPAGEGQGPRRGRNAMTVRPDPTRPMTTWRTAWRALTAAAGLGGLRFHDCRHSAITALAEGMNSDSTIRSIAGHIDARMLERYSHIRMAAKRQALDALASRPPEPKDFEQVLKPEAAMRTAADRPLEGGPSEAAPARAKAAAAGHGRAGVDTSRDTAAPSKIASC